MNPFSPLKPAASTAAVSATRVWLVIWATFLIASLLITPIPATGEPHYLCKAKHFWNPQWCQGDLFLESANAHLGFYLVWGWLTLFFSLEMTTLLGRIVSLGLLAWGWNRWLQHIVPGWWSWGIAVGVIALNCFTSLAGEWLLWGLEGKVFSYAGLFAGWAAIRERRWNSAAGWMGFAVLMHPIVGGWGTLSAMPWGIQILRGELQRTQRKRAVRQVILSGSIFLGMAWLGLWPVLRLLLDETPPSTKFAATYIQVFYRLAHHQDPMIFFASAISFYACLMAVWLVSRRYRAGQPLDSITLMAVLIALLGFAAGYGPRPPVTMPGYEWRMQLLKFYPFRLADTLIPIATLTGLAQIAAARANWNRWFTLASCGMLLVTLIATVQISSEGGMGVDRRPEWERVCHWIDRNTPVESLFHTPHDSGSFKWYANRKEFVTFKDCPQDAVALVEWNRRLREITKWSEAAFADEFYSIEEIRQLCRITGADFFLAERWPTELEPIHREGDFAVYDLRPLK